ncbi:MAG: homoserine dehydrogenase [Phycisphaerales bacterium]
MRIALLGCGNIGSALARVLSQWAGAEVCAALVRTPGRARPVPAGTVVQNVQQVLDARPHIAVECLGGVQFAAQACCQLLEAGVHVVSANKSMVAHALPALSAAAQRTGAHLRFDAAVCAGVPVLDSLARLRPAQVRSVSGIVNGTCNVVLQGMAQRSLSHAQALAEAVSAGYAEPDATADISGRDSAEKLCLLAAAAGLGSIHPQDVETHGITHLDRAALADVRTLGGAVRLLAHVNAAGGAPPLVAPTVVPPSGPFARTTGTQSLVRVQTELAGIVTLSGPGAGANPTVAALLADILACSAGQPSWAAALAAGAPAAPATAPPAALGAGAAASLVAASPATWLLRVPHEGRTLAPATLGPLLQAAGATWLGGSFLPGRALVQVRLASGTISAALRHLQEAGYPAQHLAVAEDAALWF